MRKKPFKNGAERRAAILDYVNEITQPTPLEKVLRNMRRRNIFQTLTADNLYYNVKILIKEQKIDSEFSRDFHPKRKPVLLISQKFKIE